MSIRSMNKETIALAASAIICSLLCLLRGGNGGEARETPPAFLYTPPQERAVDFANSDIGYYFRKEARDIFSIERGVGDIAVSDIPLPKLLPAPLAFPHLSPWPKGSAGATWVLIGDKSAKKPGDADLLSAENLSALLNLAEKEDRLRPNRRKEKLRDKDALFLKKPVKTVEGEIVFEDANIVKIITSLGMMEYKMEDIEKIERSTTYEEIYKQRAAAVKQGDIEGRTALAKWCLDMGMMAEALDEWKKILEFRRDYRDGYLAIAAIYHEMGNFDAEISLYNNAISALSTQQIDFIARKGALYSGLGLKENALDSYRQIIALSPSNPRGYVLAGTELVDMGKFREAIETFDKLKKLNGNPLDIASALAIAQFGLGDIESAEKLLPDARKSGIKPAEIANVSGVIYFVRGKYREAAAEFHQALLKDQYFTHAWFNLGLCYTMAGKLNEAQQLFSKGGDRDPVSVDPVVGIALCSYLADMDKEAADLFRTVVDLEKTNFYGWYAAGFLAMIDEKFTEAESCFTEALRLDYAFAPIFPNAALCYYYDEKYTEAEALLWRRTEEPRCRLILSLIGLKSGDLAGAETMLASIRGKLDQDPLYWDMAGYIEYNKRGADAKSRFAAAKEKFSTAVQRDAGDDYARSALARIAEFESLQMIEDSFSRKDSPTVGNDWVESERYGIDIKIERGACRFGGTQKVEDDGATSIQRETLAKNFLSLELTLTPERVQDAEFGLQFYPAKNAQGVYRGFQLCVDRKGKCVHGQLTSADKNPPMAQTNAAIAVNGPMRIKIEKGVGEDERENYNIFVNGTLVHAYSPSYESADSFRIVLFGKAKKAVEYAFSIDDFRIYEKRKQ